MIAPEPENGKGGRGKTSKILQVYEGDDRNAMRVAINKARAVLKYNPLLAEEVLSGMLLLDPAYKEAMAGGTGGSWPGSDGPRRTAGRVRYSACVSRPQLG
jgi:hypothetical protein